MKAVVNATPLIALSQVNQLNLLNQLFEEVFVPLGVYQEVVVQGRGRPGADEIASAPWIQVVSPTRSLTIEPLLLGLDEGELQVLLLAQEVQADWVILDERLGRRVAQAMNLPVKGTIGILLAAAQAKIISTDQALNAATRLSESGIRVSSTVLQWLEQELAKIPD